MKEIERKYLPSDKPMDLTKWDYSVIRQGYLLNDTAQKAHLRVRIQTDHVFLTTSIRATVAYKKDITIEERTEIEFPIPFNKAELLLDMCPHKLEKERWTKVFDGWTVTVDKFEGGFTIIEVEAPDVEHVPEFPAFDFLGKDVTGIKKYTQPEIAKKLAKDGKITIKY